MRITKHDNAFIQMNHLFPCNCYLVREDDGFTLIDTGITGSAKTFLKTAEANGAAIRRIVITHNHPDHIGSLDALHKLIPDAEVLVGEQTERFMSGDMRLNPNESDKTVSGAAKCSTRPTRVLRPGDRAGSLEVIAAPGHSPDQIAYFDVRTRALFAGDAFTTQAGIHTAGTIRWLFPFASMKTWDKQAGLRTAEKLAALNPAWLATGHGKVLRDPAPAMQRAIAEARRNIESSGWQPNVV